MWSTVGYLRAIFDESLPVPPIAEKGRTGLVDLLPPAQPQLVHAFDTTDMDSPPMDFGRNGHAEVPQ